jgi:hypothetical protein
MPTHDEIIAAIHGVTGNPDTGVVHDITGGIADAIDALVNPPASKPTEAAAYRPAKETR